MNDEPQSNRALRIQLPALVRILRPAYLPEKVAGRSIKRRDQHASMHAQLLMLHSLHAYDTSDSLGVSFLAVFTQIIMLMA
jgi:hypothetical protein